MRVWFQTGHANKSLKHIGIVNNWLAGWDGKWDVESLTGGFGQIDTRQRVLWSSSKASSKLWDWTAAPCQYQVVRILINRDCWNQSCRHRQKVVQSDSIKCLHSLKSNAILIICIDESNSQQLKATLHGTNRRLQTRSIQSKESCDRTW